MSKIHIYKIFNPKRNVSTNEYEVYVEVFNPMCQYLIEWCRTNNLVDESQEWLWPGIKWIEIHVNMDQERKLEFDLTFL